jgi:hypothetical protein
MSDAANTEFTTDELLSHAQGNATAFALATIAYLKERDLAVDDYIRFFGGRFAPGWEELRTQPVVAVARSAALNAVSVGGALRSLSGMRQAPRWSSRGGPPRRSRTRWGSSVATARRCGTASSPLWSTWASATLGGARTGR